MNQCAETIVFGDDFGDNPCTFHCQLEAGHKGEHTEGGNQEGETYTLRWGRTEPATHDAAKRIEELEAELERTQADKQRLFDRVSQLEEIIHESRAALDKVMIAPPRGAMTDGKTSGFQKIDPELGW